MPKTKEKETKPKDSKPNKKNGWYELVSEKAEFQNIVRILNRYYNLNPQTNHPTPAYVFREEIVLAKLESIRIFLKKFGSFEFLVVVELSSEKGNRMDSWIHIDGVSQERVIMTEKGNLQHPVFSITCLEDLYKSHTKPVGKGFKPKVEDLIL
ncbi:MAG: hypothetical protein IPL26_18130 [Leptospiraceae bacterium]|nr:hypothetical protein [Leptospiraceae bacterium]